MKPLSLALASLVFASPSLAASRIWPDPGATCRPALVRLAPGEENATVVFSTPRKFDFPTTLSIANAAVDSPNAAIVRFKLTSGVWQQCVYALEPEHRKTYQRTECTTSNVTGLELQLAQVEAVMPAGESTLHVALREPPPCASTPRSYDKLTVTQGGKFFPKDNPESSRWVAVLDERLISEEQVEQVANDLASQYGVSLVALMHGPYGFSFEGSYSKAKNLAFNGWIRFVESDVDYFGFGYVEAELPFPATPNSWALDRLDQRESHFETAEFANGASTARDNRYRFPETSKPLGGGRPRVFVVDTDALTSHASFAGFTIDSQSVPGAQPQCPAGGMFSGHGTESLSMIIGKAGVVRAQPRQVVQVAGLGQAGSGCAAASQSQVVAALTTVASSAERGDILSLSFGSRGFGMVVEMTVSAIVQQGVLIFAATGNEKSLTLYPPASSDGAFAIGGIQDTGRDDKWDQPDAGSNGMGADVDFHGPAREVQIAGDSSNLAIKAGFGTSLAAPLVAGIGFYQVLTSDFSAVAAPDLRDRVAEMLRGAATVRSATQIVVPFTPTRPVFGTSQLIPKQVLLVEAANDGESTWLAGYRTNSGALLRVPTGTSSDPTAPNPGATQSIWHGGANSQCRAVAASYGQATAGCWSPSEGGSIRLFDVVDGVAQSTASLEVTGVPVAVAVDIADNQTTDPNRNIRAALVQPVDYIESNGNPVLLQNMRLTFARKTGPNSWALAPPIDLFDSTRGYSPTASLAVNCPGPGVPGGTAPDDCDAFALITKVNGTGVPLAVQLWKTTFNTANGSVGSPALLAERTGTPPFTLCSVPGWAGGQGLESVGLSVDTANANIFPFSRWSFAYNRLGTGYFGLQCGFDSQAHVVNGDSQYDVSGPRGEAWSRFSRGEFSRTGLAVTSVWNPATATITHQLRSTIRTLHPRGAAPVPSTDVSSIVHSVYGEDAMALSSTDGVNWSIARVQP